MGEKGALSESELRKRKQDFETRARAHLKRKLTERGIADSEHEAILLQRKLCIQKGEVLPPLPKAEEAEREGPPQNAGVSLYKRALLRIQCHRLSFLFHEQRAGRLKGPVFIPLRYSQFYKHCPLDRNEAQTDASLVKREEDLESLMPAREYMALVTRFQRHFPPSFLDDVARLANSRR